MRIHLFWIPLTTRMYSPSLLSTLFQCLFTLVFKTAPQLSPFCATSAAACDLSSNLIGQPVLSWSWEKFDTLDAKKSLLFHAASDRAWCEWPHRDLLFQYKSVIAPNFCIQCGKAFRVGNDDDIIFGWTIL